MRFSSNDIEGLFEYCLLLKTENRKHCSKIIFKYVNSIVRPSFKVVFLKKEKKKKKVLAGSMNSARDLLKNVGCAKHGTLTVIQTYTESSLISEVNSKKLKEK